MEAKNKALEVELSEEKQMRQDKEQEVGQLSTILLKSLSRQLKLLYFVKSKRAFLSRIAKDHIQIQKEKQKFSCRLFTSSIKRKIRNFPVVVVQ